MITLSYRNSTTFQGTESAHKPKIDYRVMVSEK